MTREQAIKEAVKSLDVWYKGEPDHKQIEDVLKALRLDAQANMLFESVLELKK